MGKSGKIVLVVILLAAAAGAIVWRLKGSGTESLDPVASQAWVCEEDGTAFTAPVTVPPRTCPQCGKPTGVLRFSFECQKCKTQFEAGWMKLAPDVERKFAAMPADERESLPMNWELATVTRKPGASAWTADPITPVCPQCGNRDRRTIKQLTP